MGRIDGQWRNRFTKPSGEKIEAHAPIIRVQILNPDTKKGLEVNALIDTGAGPTCIARETALDLDLPVANPIQAEAPPEEGGEERESPCYRATLRFTSTDELSVSEKTSRLMEIPEARLWGSTPLLLGWTILRFCTLATNPDGTFTLTFPDTK